MNACHFLGHEDDEPDFLGEVRCVHCGDLAPPWAHVGITCAPGLVLEMFLANAVLVASQAMARAFEQTSPIVQDILDAIAPILEFADSLAQVERAALEAWRRAFP